MIYLNQINLYNQLNNKIRRVKLWEGWWVGDGLNGRNL